MFLLTVKVDERVYCFVTVARGGQRLTVLILFHWGETDIWSEMTHLALQAKDWWADITRSHYTFYNVSICWSSSVFQEILLGALTKYWYQSCNFHNRSTCAAIIPLSPYSYRTARPSNQSTASCFSWTPNGQFTSCRYCTQEKKHNSCMCLIFPQQQYRCVVGSKYQIPVSFKVCYYFTNWLNCHLLVGLGPVWAGDVPQVASVLNLIVSNLLVLQPHNAVPKLCLIWAEGRQTGTHEQITGQISTAQQLDAMIWQAATQINTRNLNHLLQSFYISV